MKASSNLVCVLMAFFAMTSCTAQKNKKPNIIYILADDMGYNELGAYGGKLIETPNIDKLATHGIKFTNHYAGSNICAPSRCALLTGKHTGNSWIRDNKPLPFEGNEPIKSSEVTVAEIFKKANYTTGVFGKWGLGYPNSEGSPDNQGFDEFYGYNCQRHAHSYYTNYMRQNNDSIPLNGNIEAPFTDFTADVIHNQALSFIENNQDKPFFLYYASTLPHNPYHQPDDELLTYYEKKFNIAKGDASDKGFTEPKYAAMSTRLDRQVGELIAKLKHLGILENTLIIFSSDNGTALRPNQDKFLKTGGNLQGRKGQVYEGGIKAPMIAFWQGKIKPGTTSSHISAFWDFLPTCAELVNIENPKDIDGISFLPTLLGQEKQQKKHDYLYWERNQSQAIRKDDMKAVISYDKTTKKQSVEIYNVRKDPNEKINLADSRPKLRNEFIKLAKTARVESELFPLIKNR
ncbi:arylsulfatase [Polaribacter sp. Hel_I_88]|uniref:arylsulfatase n=1 Tax=Polaribacter sp. Hel_I_88 TaxID=1250006 RepID=UPI00047EE1E0|nr:arylsulfatase [Polaribacter sp. Hel_I_88]